MKRKLVFLLYYTALVVLFPFIVLYGTLRILRDRRYLHTVKERFGWLPPTYWQTAPGSVWVHAVSVGEVISCTALMRELKTRDFKGHIFVSVATLAGREVAEQRLAGLADGIFYAPLDYPWIVNRVLRMLRPALLVVLETEIWPALWRQARLAGARVMIVNARISDKSWPKYRRFRWFFAAVLAEPDTILAQSDVSRQRYLDLGADPCQLAAVGNLKYDFTPGPAPAEVLQLIESSRPVQVWIAASTMPGSHSGDCDEHHAVLDAFERLSGDHPRLLLLLAPRQPGQFDEVANRLKSRGIPYLRRSALLREGKPSQALPAVLLLDTIGELSSLFEHATVVFVGGTLADRGGHNLLEPALAGKPVICGPHLENFPQIADEFRSAAAMVEIGQAAELAGAVGRLLADDKLCATLGERGRALAKARQGTTKRAAALACELVDRAMPVRARNTAARWMLGCLAALWTAGSRWKMRREQARPKRLPVPVVSVGALAMGGSGKTPFTIWLGGKLRERGKTVGVLTRGYRRRDANAVTVIARGEAASVDLTGDEGQLLVRADIGAVGIARNRYDAGLAVLERVPASVLLLDDGFQHWQLSRDLDIVLIDALDPFAGGIFPLGRLREPFEALSRAGAVVISRAPTGQGYRMLMETIRRYNPRCPVTLCRMRSREWIENGGTSAWSCDAPPLSSALAFCGLGNPASFWNSLDDLGVRCLGRRAFADHHPYSPRDIRSLAAEAQAVGADALVTTEKDLMNLPPEAAKAVGSVRLYALRVEVEVDAEEDFLDYVCGFLKK